MSEMMQTVTLNRLLVALDTSDAANRAVVADALDETGRTTEAKILRSDLPVCIRSGKIRPELSISDHGSNDEGWPVQWINCSWGKSYFGGCWVSDGSLNGNGQPTDPWDVTAYRGWEMTGNDLPDEEYYKGMFGLDLNEEEVGELTEWVQKASERVCQEEAYRLRDGILLVSVREAFAAGEGNWTGCDWSTGNDYAPASDLDGLTAEDAAEYAAEVRTALDGGDLPSERAQGTTCWDMDDDNLTVQGADADDLAHAWDRAAEYLRSVEAAAEEAEEEARLALESAEAGEWNDALRHAEAACRLESEYGDCPTWRFLRQAIETARKQV